MLSAPITDYFPNPRAIIEPTGIRIDHPGSDRAVICFFHDLLATLVEEGSLVEVGAMGSEMGRHPLYVHQAVTPTGPRPVFVFHPGVGAPLAVGLTEDVIASGVNRLIVCGGCGVLKPEIAAGHPLILTAAVRDEGVSYHYLPPALESYPHPQAVAALQAACQAGGIDYRLAKSWTTDAYFRETPERAALRASQGCDVVEMEASALFALAEFRQVILGQIVYGGDLVIADAWDSRDWHKRSDDRRLMFQIAIEACLKL